MSYLLQIEINSLDALSFACTSSEVTLQGSAYIHPKTILKRQGAGFFEFFF